MKEDKVVSAMIIIVLAFVLFVIGMVVYDDCKGGKKVQHVTTTESSDDFEVVKLFKMQDCTIYRFLDSGHYRYFTDCEGETMTTVPQQCGKAQCPYPENIKTKRNN